MNREDFPILQSDLIYFDNGATTLKPSCVIDAIVDYYKNYTANTHRGDYKNSLLVDENIDRTRKAVQRFIHAKSEREIIFTENATDSLIQIIFGFFKYKLKKGDHVVLTKSEHASNVLPWFELEEEIGIKIDYIPLDEHLHVTLDRLKEVITKDTKVISIAEVTNVIGEVTMENVIKSITDKTKVISIAHISNVIGDVRPIKEIINYAHKKGILVVVDGAQSAPHKKTDVQELDADFFVFSLHKMCGPTGVGILYGKLELLNEMKPLKYGGGMNVSFTSDGSKVYQSVPTLFEAGTIQIAGIIASRFAIEYLEKIGMDQIHDYEMKLKEYALKRLQEVPGIQIYNPDTDSAIISFNIDGIFAQDLAVYLDHYHICVRAGSHCAKILIDEIGIKNTCRMSLYFYNTKEEIDRMVEVLKNPNILEESLDFISVN